MYSILYDAVTPTVGKMTLYSFIIFTHLFLFRITAGTGAKPCKHWTEDWTEGRETPWTAVLELGQYSPIQSSRTVLALLCVVIFHCLTVDQTRAETYFTKYCNFCHRNIALVDIFTSLHMLKNILLSMEKSNHFSVE